MNNSELIEEFQKLLRGEISATETYRQAVSSIDSTHKILLQEILEEHELSVLSIKKHLLKLGGEHMDNSGVWGVVAQAIEGSATMLGTSATVAALKQGELLGINDYENLLRGESLQPECHLLISKELLPLCKKHVLQLENFDGGAEF